MKTSRLRARRATPGDRRLLGPQHRRREPLASLCRVGREVPPFVEVSSGGRPQHGGLRTGVLVGFDRLVQIRDETDTAILMIEQNARKALSVSDRGYVLDMGENRFKGTGDDLLESDDVAELYLGG